MTSSQHLDRGVLPTAGIFYERELGKLSRPSRGWAQGCCPFHQSKSRMSFSVHLTTGGFFCHGCGVKGGDIVAFMMKRYGMKFRAACESLGAWVGGSEADRTRIDQESKRQQELEAKESARQELIRARDWLHTVERLYDEAVASADWELMPRLLQLRRDAETDYWQAAGLEVRHE